MNYTQIFHRVFMNKTMVILNDKNKYENTLALLYSTFPETILKPASGLSIWTIIFYATTMM